MDHWTAFERREEVAADPKMLQKGIAPQDRGATLVRPHRAMPQEPKHCRYLPPGYGHPVPRCVPREGGLEAQFPWFLEMES